MFAEIFGVAKHKVCLLGPCYECSSAEGKHQMARLGYIRDLPGAVRDLGGVLEIAYE